MSCAVLIGIVSLIPAYFFSYTQEKEVLSSLASLQKGRQERGTNTILSELAESNKIIKTLKGQNKNVIYSDIISQIIHQKPSGLTINSFNVVTVNSSSTVPVDVSLQGKASTRDALIKFKNNVEASAFVTKVDLPISDLAKNKDLSFSMKISFAIKI